MATETFLEEWAQCFLDIMREHESDSRLGGPCRSCGSLSSAVYRCEECFQPAMLCQRCIVSQHEHIPFHFIQRWNGQCFERKTLLETGLTICLGHHSSRCPSIPAEAPNRESPTSQLTVIHVNGIQDIRVQYCTCIHPPGRSPDPRPLQL